MMDENNAPNGSARLDDEQDARLWLNALTDAPELDPARRAEMREAFLAQAAEVARGVSARAQGRRKGWRRNFRKEHPPMFSLARTLIVLALALGGVGTSAAYASQSSLPGEVLYGVKLVLEDAQLGLTTDPQEEIALLGDLVGNRLQELQALLEEGLPVSNQLMMRLEEHLQLALKRSAELEDPALIMTMEQIRLRAEEQLMLVRRLRQSASVDQEQALEKTERAILRVRSEAEEAIQDPTSFRMRLGNERPEDAPDQPETIPPGKQGQGGGPNGADGGNHGSTP